MDEDFFDDGEMDHDLIVALDGSAGGAGGADLPSDAESFPRSDGGGADRGGEGGEAGEEGAAELGPMFFPVSSSEEAARINQWRAQYQSFRLGGAQGARGQLRRGEEADEAHEEAAAAAGASSIKKKRLFVLAPLRVRAPWASSAVVTLDY